MAMFYVEMYVIKHKIPYSLAHCNHWKIIKLVVIRKCSKNV